MAIMVGLGMSGCASPPRHLASHEQSAPSDRATESSSPSLIENAAGRTLLRTASVIFSLVASGGPDVTSITEADFPEDSAYSLLMFSGSSDAGLFGSPITIAYSGANAYLKATESMTAADGGLPWALVTPPTMQALFSMVEPGADAAPLADIAGSNPAELIGILDTSDMEVINAGTGIIDGTRATQYHVLIQDDAAEQSTTGITQEILREFSSAGSGSTTVDVWVDTSGLLRQISAYLSFPGYTISFTSRISDFGLTAPVLSPAYGEIGPLNLSQMQVS